ncbi:MAG: class III poly(R)-hydroxyalkanoic acid synthase subunit PhaC [Defluviitaleaceae bacterium]|nr:class III poly(R)-hydroxyalkanoic acid synthase subunit PhaC [Defluviitaleaceae bacterium]
MNFNNYSPHKNVHEILGTTNKLMSGLRNMMEIEDIEMATTPKELVFKQDNMKVYRYKPTVKNPHGVPVLVVYALVNRHYMLDIQENRSTIKKWLDEGLDVYIIDWGYPGQVDKHLTMEDYIDGYIGSAVDFVCEASKKPAINLLGICQGATMSVIYSALYPEKVKNLITMVMPFDFDVADGLLNRFAAGMDIDAMIGAARGLLSGESMNFGYNMLKPFELSFDKYIFFVDRLDNKDALIDFLRMETWIYDSPSQAGPMLSKFVKDLYQDNLLMKNKMTLGGRKVDLKNIKMPVLCMLGEKDHLVPPASTRPFVDAVGSKDKTLWEFNLGHIGMFVSSAAQKEIGPKVGQWIKER